MTRKYKKQKESKKTQEDEVRKDNGIPKWLAYLTIIAVIFFVLSLLFGYTILPGIDWFPGKHRY